MDDNMEDDGTKKYQIIIDGQVSHNSRGYSGFAKAIYPTEVEEIYEGEYLDGKRHGNGSYSYKNGDRYVGEWRHNEKHGIGRLTYAIEGEYFGRFENGKRHGEGVFTYKKSNDVYSGFWQYGQKHGEGTYTFSQNKLKLNGNWDNGNIVFGKWIFPNGIYWEGKFNKNKPIGEGSWKFPDGNQVKGEFKQTEDENAEPLPDSDEKPIKISFETKHRVYNPKAFEEIII